MTDRDPILDACLDEVLGGRTPPDLTARILRGLAARDSMPPSEPQPASDMDPPGLAAPPLLSALPVPEPPPIVAANGQPVVELRPKVDADEPARRSRWQPLLIAASILTIGLTVSVVTIALSNRTPIADNATPQPPGPTIASAGPDSVAESGSTPSRDTPSRDEERTSNPGSPSDPGSTDPDAPTRQPIVSIPPDEPPAAPTAAPPMPTLPSRRYLEPSPDAEIVSFVSAELGRSWTEASITPAPAATDSEWCRRLFVRVLGRIPTVEELESFKNDKAGDKRERLVERLLSPVYAEEYARHWAGVWTNVLIGRTGGQSNSLASREGLEQYLTAALTENKPYDEIVHELLTATGAAQPGAPDYNGAVNFLLDGWGKDATVPASRVARVLLGTQLQCAQCHTHPTQDLHQDQFWGLNAFLRQTKVERDGNGASLVNAESRASERVQVFYETPAGILKSAQPKFLDGTEFASDAEVDRRAELARLVVRSDQLPRAVVNRLWSHFFGYGFTRPVDDLGPNASPSHPELLDRLAREFEAHEYDLKSVIRWIVLSDAFARSSRLADVVSRDMPEAGEVALFSRYYARPMQAEEVYNSLVQAAQIRRTATTAAEVASARRAWLGQFHRNMATDDGHEESHFSGVRQSLILMNGDLTRQAVSTQHEGLLKTLAASDMTFSKKVEHLFLAALSREPTRREQRAAETILANSKGVETTALEDILWALLNSNEFILDH